MNGDDLTIKGIFEFLFPGRGAKEAKEQLDDAGKAADKTKTKFKGLDSTTEELGRKLKQYLGGAALAALIKSSVSQFAAYERGLSAIGKQLQALGADQAAAVPQIRAFLESVEKGTGVLRQDALPVFQKFLGITKSVDGAMYATRLATDLTNAGLGDMGTNGERLANLLQGEVTEAAKSLGLQLRDNSGHIKTQSQLLDELIGLYGGFGTSQKDAQSQIEKTQSGFNNLKQTIGTAVAPALNVVANIVAHLVNALQSIGPVAAMVFSEAKGRALQFGATLKAVFNLKKLIQEGPSAYMAELLTAGNEAVRNMKLEQEGAAEELIAIWNDAADQINEHAEQGRKDITAVAKAKENAAAQADIERRLAFEKSAQEKLLQARIAATKKGSEAELVAQLELLEHQHKAAVEAAHQVQASTAAIDETFRLEKQALQDDFNEQQDEQHKALMQKRAEREVQNQIAILDAQAELLTDGDDRKLQLLLARLDLERDLELANTELTEQEKTAIRAKFEAKAHGIVVRSETASAAFKKQQRMQELNDQQQMAGALMGIAATMFGKNKAVAIAQTMIQTYFGAAKALAENPPPSPIGIISAAFVIAQGIKRANDIRKQNAGFDDPAHDRLAYLGGRRWAVDMVRNLDLGFKEGMAAAFPRLAGSMSNVVNNTTNDNSLHAHFGSTPLGGRAAARQIVRQLDRARWREQSRAFA